MRHCTVLQCGIPFATSLDRESQLCRIIITLVLQLVMPLLRPPSEPAATPRQPRERARCRKSTPLEALRVARHLTWLPRRLKLASSGLLLASPTDLGHTLAELVIARGFNAQRRTNAGLVCVLTNRMHRRGHSHPVPRGCLPLEPIQTQQAIPHCHNGTENANGTKKNRQTGQQKRHRDKVKNWHSGQKKKQHLGQDQKQFFVCSVLFFFFFNFFLSLSFFFLFSFCFFFLGLNCFTISFDISHKNFFFELSRGAPLGPFFLPFPLRPPPLDPSSSAGPLKISLFFNVHSFFPLLEFSRGIVGAVQGRISQKVRVWASLGPFCETPALTHRGPSGPPPLGPPTFSVFALPHPSGPTFGKTVNDESVINYEEKLWEW